MSMLRALWNYRGFIVGSVKREFQTRYQNSLLGAAWNVLNPLSMIVVYTVIFSEIMKTRLPHIEGKFAFSIYLCSGLLTWGLFSETVTRAMGVFIENANLLKKLSFPRLCLPVIVVANSLLNFSIIFGIFIVFLVATGSFPGWPFLALIPLLLIQIVFSVGLGISLGILNVFFRDVGQFFGIFISFWFWFTPIAYPVTILPDFAQTLMRFNPMARMVNAYQDVLVAQSWPNWYSLWPVLVLGLLLCAWGFQMFRRRVGEMVDEL
jgi:lipopolysaccharide transport system permease protein